MSAVLEPPTDQWLLPVLRDILPQSAIEQVESTVAVSYWRAIVEGGLATDEDLLAELSARTHFRIATDLLVSTEACERVPEKLARKFGVLPLSISQTILDIATANPYDLDCEKTLAFATGRTVRMSLAPPHRIIERIEEDRKSTRLNSSHVAISYAVFCLKKKNI